jgi:hypothetical protein
MKSLIIKSAAVLCVFATASCMTTYDRDGRPVQSVDPGAAAVGAVAAGVLGYAIASGNNDHHDHDRYDRRYDRRRYYRHY